MPCRVFPSEIYEFNNSPALAREIETLRTLQLGLSQAYCVFHSVHWTRAVSPKSRAMGEIDFIVMNRAGDLLLLEQKTGQLSVKDGQLWKSYGQMQSEKSVLMQIERNQDGLVNKFRKVTGRLLKTQNVLFCPDYKILNAKVSGLDRNQIIDATDAAQLCSRLTNLLSEGESDPNSKEVERFLKNELLIQEDLVKISTAQDAFSTRLASGLTEWVGRLELTPYRLQIQGTAGSGKTQLAITELSSAQAKRKSALYVSFNKPLAIRMATLFSAPIKVTSFYSYCEELVRAEDKSMAHKSGYLTEDINDLFLLAASVVPTQDDLYDLVVVDEGQDFTQEQAEFLMSWCKLEGKILWLEDPVQNIYGKPPVFLKGWAKLLAPVNFRNPKSVAQLLMRLLDVIEPGHASELIGANPVEGMPVQFIGYKKSNPQSLKDSTEQAVKDLRQKGFNTDQITVLAFKGVKSSSIFAMSYMDGLAIKKPDIQRSNGYTEGVLEVDTLYRFKGLSNLAIVLTEVEFEQLNPRIARLLFVGASRAKIALTIVHDSPLEKFLSKAGAA